jgi:hypothetical protein
MFKVWDAEQFYEGPTPGDAIALMRAHYDQGKSTLDELSEVTLPEEKEKKEA